MFETQKQHLARALDAAFETYYDPDTQVMRAGHNGPYHHPESPVRVTAHWLTILSKIAALPEHRDQSLARISALQEGIKRTHDRSLKNFVSRLQATAEVDAMNGTIGAAWVFEGLAQSLALVEDQELRVLCREIYANHHFAQTKGLWHRCYPDGTKGRFDQTFNHQLWFAHGAAALFHEDAQVMRDVERFLTCLDRNMGQYEDGLIYHPMPYKADLRSKISVCAKHVFGTLETLRERKGRKLQQINYERDMYRKSIGYHSFNLYALAGLWRQTPEHPFFAGKAFNKALKYIVRPDYRAGLDLEIYFGYPYNLSGFECLSAVSAFSERFTEEELHAIAPVIEEQFARLDPQESGQLDPDCADLNTYIASCYKALV